MRGVLQQCNDFIIGLRTIRIYKLPVVGMRLDATVGSVYHFIPTGSMLSFTLLGQTTMAKDGQPLDRFRSQKEAALLVFLAHTGQSHPRDAVAELLWSDRTTQQALSNLRTALSRLRKQVGDALIVTRKSLTLAPESLRQVDSANLLQTLAEQGPIGSMDEATSLQAALDAYAGDFLVDFYVADAPRFDEWVVTTREQIRRQVIAAYDKLARHALSTRRVEDGIAITRRWLQADALDEAAHTLLICLLLEAGDARGAVAHYDHCVEVLRRELDIAPSAEMTALLARVRPQPSGVGRVPARVRHNLPAPHDQFFDRDAARQEIHARLDQPWCRLVTIASQGGVGKTRLAATIARSRLDKYPDGAWLAELAEIDPDDADPAEAIAVEIATALDLRLSGTATPVEQLLDHLQHKEMLLVLDNLEHLLAGLQIVLDLIQQCEHVQLIVTSREALRIRAEWTVALTGLDHPTTAMDDQPCHALDLFAARRAQHRRGRMSAEDLTAARSICRMVEGLPLAIELAAALTNDVPFQQVAHQLDTEFDALATTLRDMPPRHRSLRVIFEMSWRAFTPALQQRLARLARFRGGFTETAAQHIAKATAQDLVGLCDKSLLTLDEALGRYSLHAVVRAYAAEKRPATDQTPQRHARYYLTLLASQLEPLQQSRPQAAMAEIQADIDNVRLAWQTGLAARAADLLLAALMPLSIYYQLRGLAHEAESVMQSALRSAHDWGSDGLALAVRAGVERARFQIRLGRYRPAIETVKRTIAAARQCADRWADGMAHVLWGEALRLGEYEPGQQKLEHARTVADTIDDDRDSTLLVGWYHHHLGVINDLQGRYDLALEHLDQACIAWRETGNMQALSGSLNSIGLVHHHRGDLPSAQKAMEQALTLCNQLDSRHLQSFLLNNLSIISTERGDYLTAHQHLQRSLELAITSGNVTSQGEIYGNTGRNYHLRGESDLAVEYLERGLQIAELIGNHALMAQIKILMADVNRFEGRQETAESLYEQALAITIHYLQFTIYNLLFTIHYSHAHVTDFDARPAPSHGR